MSTALFTRNAASVEEALSRYIHVLQDWIVWDMPQSSAERGGWFRLLVENGKLPGSARYCLTAHDDLRLRADIPRTPASNVAYSQDETGEVSAADTDPIALVVEGLIGEHGATCCADIADLCSASVWPCTARPEGGHVTVELEMRAGALSAIVAPVSNGFEVTADLVTVENATTGATNCMEAIGLFLLRLGGCTRMVRPVARSAGDTIVLSLAVHVPATQVELSLSHSFPALGIAASLARTECRALLDPAVAATYLHTSIAIAKGN